MRRISPILKSMLLPLLLATYPGLFHYSNNAAMILLVSLGKVLLINIAVMIILYIFFYIFSGWKALQASIDTFLFLLFYNTYGITLHLLKKLNIFPVHQSMLLPLFCLLGLSVAWLANKLKPALLKGFWNVAALVLGGMVLYNVILIAPHEIAKVNHVQAKTAVSQNSTTGKKYPDIYYIVLDEFSGFQPMRDYWHYNGVDDFKQFLIEKGFFVAEQSRSSSIVTLKELATRLNYQDYPCCNKYQIYFEAIAGNRAMAYLKAKGYTTVVFEPSKAVFPADLPMAADYLYEKAPEGNSAPPSLIDEFSVLNLDNTMMFALSNFYKPLLLRSDYNNYRNMVYFSKDRSTNLGDVPSPKFVYVHMFLPHVPFMFDANGNLNSSEYYYNWNFYLGHYIFATKVASDMINRILSQADPNNPPVIILQSDHGARNESINDNILLKDFPEKDMTSILFTLHLSGYDYSKIPQDINPINTFPIVFNDLFDANIPLVK